MTHIPNALGTNMSATFRTDDLMQSKWFGTLRYGNKWNIKWSQNDSLFIDRLKQRVTATDQIKKKDIVFYYFRLISKCQFEPFFISNKLFQKKKQQIISRDKSNKFKTECDARVTFSSDCDAVRVSGFDC